MGERNWHQRYRDAREYADEQARAYERGDIIENWRQVSEHDTRREKLTGAAWVTWAYEIAASTAHTMVQVHGAGWQPLVDECERLAQEYREKAKPEMRYCQYCGQYHPIAAGDFYCPLDPKRI